MKVFTIAQDPSTEEIAAVLQKEFSSKYTYSFFGVGKNRSIVVRKSEFVGAQISKSADQLTVHATPPNLLLSLLDPLSGMNIVGAIFHPKLRMLEKELVTFLQNRYAAPESGR